MTHDKEVMLAAGDPKRRPIVLFAYHHGCFVRLNRGSVEKLT